MGGLPMARVVTYFLGVPIAVAFGAVIGLVGGAQLGLEEWARFVREWKGRGK